jgi:hypothetical protein
MYRITIWLSGDVAQYIALRYKQDGRLAHQLAQFRSLQASSSGYAQVPKRQEANKKTQ